MEHIRAQAFIKAQKELDVITRQLASGQWSPTVKAMFRAYRLDLLATMSYIRRKGLNPNERGL